MMHFALGSWGIFFFFNPKIGMFHADSSKLMQVIQLGLSCLCEFKGLFGTCGNGQSILFLILLLFGLGLLIRNETRIYIYVFFKKVILISPNLKFKIIIFEISEAAHGAYLFCYFLF